MAQNHIPEHVRTLIAQHIDSIQQVEILALMRREPRRVFTPVDVSRALRIAPEACASWIELFAAAGLVQRSGAGYRHVDRGRQSRAADDLLELFARRRLAVVESIYNKPQS